MSNQEIAEPPRAIVPGSNYTILINGHARIQCCLSVLAAAYQTNGPVFHWFTSGSPGRRVGVTTGRATQ